MTTLSDCRGGLGACGFLTRLALLLIGGVGPLLAAVSGVEIATREDLLAGRSFSLAGPYEVLRGKLKFAVDPDNAANKAVVDIEYAPVNNDGRVEFSSDFLLVKPKDVKRGNGALLLKILNRGNLSGHYFNRGRRGNEISAEATLGDALLLRNGFSVMWVGWQFDTPRLPDRLRMYSPAAKEGGKPIRGPGRRTR